MSQIGRNDSCHCGSKKKYKKCHLEKDEKKDSQKRAKAALNAAKVAAKEAKEAEKKQGDSRRRGDNQEGWFKKISGKMPFFQKRNLPSTRHK